MAVNINRVRSYSCGEKLYSLIFIIVIFMILMGCGFSYSLICVVLITDIVIVFVEA